MKLKKAGAKTSVIRLINTHQAKTELSSLVRDVEEHGSIYRVCRNGKPVAKLRPIQHTLDPLEIHPEISKVKFLADPMEPVGEEDWPEDMR